MLTIVWPDRTGSSYICTRSTCLAEFYWAVFFSLSRSVSLSVQVVLFLEFTQKGRNVQYNYSYMYGMYFKYRLRLRYVHLQSHVVL